MALRLSSRSRYGTRIMVYLARNAGITSKKREIADAEGISSDYVEQLLVRLKTVGLVRSTRGAHGGFTIACDPAATTVLDVVHAMDGTINLVPCEDEDCERVSSCVASGVWRKADAAVEGVFSQITLGDLASEAEKLREGKALAFQI